MTPDEEINVTIVRRETEARLSKAAAAAAATAASSSSVS